MAANRSDSVKCPYCAHFGCPATSSRGYANTRVRYRKCSRCGQAFRTETRMRDGKKREIIAMTGHPVVRPGDVDPANAGKGYVRPKLESEPVAGGGDGGKGDAGKGEGGAS